jgi:hypothetical protein
MRQAWGNESSTGWGYRQEDGKISHHYEGHKHEDKKVIKVKAIH